MAVIMVLRPKIVGVVPKFIRIVSHCGYSELTAMGLVNMSMQ